jgi:uncharacterized membrane protein
MKKYICVFLFLGIFVFSLVYLVNVISKDLKETLEERSTINMFVITMKHEKRLKNIEEQQKKIDSLMNGFRHITSLDQEKTMTPFEIIASRYTHLEVCSPSHPLYTIYKDDFKKINYNKEYEIWK